MSTLDVAAPSKDLASLQALVWRYGSELSERDAVIAKHEAAMVRFVKSPCLAVGWVVVRAC